MSSLDMESRLRLYEALCENLREGIVLLDDTGAVVHLNDRVRTVLALDGGQLEGEHYTVVLEELSFRTGRERLETALTDVFDGTTTEQRVDLELENPSGFPIAVEARVTRFEHDGVAGALVVLRDVTERKQSEDTLERTTEQLAVANRVLRHDIRNDVHVMMGWAEELRPHVDGGEPAAMLDRIIRHSRHVVELTEEARDLVDAIESDWEMPLKPVDVKAVLVREIESNSEKYPRAEFSIPEQLPSVTVEANAFISSVFTNVLSNAVIHNDADTPKVDVDVETGVETVRVSVRDNGPGIPEPKREFVFGEGEQGLDSPGTGMGLYLVHSLVEAYGGTVHIADNEPRGTVVTIELPAAEITGTDASRTD